MHLNHKETVLKTFICIIPMLFHLWDWVRCFSIEEAFCNTIKKKLPLSLKILVLIKIFCILFILGKAI